MRNKGMVLAAVICALVIPGLAGKASAASETICAAGTAEGILSLGGTLQKKSVRKARAVPAEYEESYDTEIISAIEGMETEIPVEGSGITKENVTEIINRIWNTNPQLFYLQKWEYSYYPSTGEVKELLFVYTGTEEEIMQQQSDIEEALEGAKEAVDAEGMTEEEIALALHDYLAAHVKYAYDDYLEDTADSSAYNIYGALVKGEAVCQGYALAYEYLLNQYGISNGIASSDAANHAWNIVEIGNNWYHVDVTWDDPPYDNLGQALHGAFLISTDTVFSLEPERADYVTLTVPGCTYEEAADASFEGGFWRDSSAAMYYYGGCWYYTERTAFEIVKYQYTTQQKEVLVQLKEHWPDWEDSSCWLDENFCRIVRINETLYYSTPASVYALPLGGGEITKVFSADTSGGYIYGLGTVDGKLAYVLKTEASGDEPELVLEADFSSTIPAVPENTVTSQPAPPAGNAGQTGSTGNAADNGTGGTAGAGGSGTKAAVSVARQSIRSLKSRKSRCLTVVWKKDTRADGYQICCSTSKNFTRAKTRVIRIRNNKKRKYTIKKLKSKKKYYVKVRAYKKAGSVCYYGSYSKRKAVKVK